MIPVSLGISWRTALWFILTLGAAVLLSAMLASAEHIGPHKWPPK